MVNAVVEIISVLMAPYHSIGFVEPPDVLVDASDFIAMVLSGWNTVSVHSCDTGGMNTVRCSL
jgi:hypothetical protein